MSTETKQAHTAGDWRFYRDDSFREYAGNVCAIPGKERKRPVPICRLATLPEEEMQANAALIAKAYLIPECEAAIESLLLEVTNNNNDRPNKSGYTEEVQVYSADIVRLESLLAKLKEGTV